MKPMGVRKVIGYDEDNRRTFNEVFETNPLGGCKETSNEVFERFEAEQTKRHG